MTGNFASRKIMRFFQEEPALKFAHSSGLLVTAAGDAVPTDELKELQFRSKAVAALAALVCARCGAGMAFENSILRSAEYGGFLSKNRE